MSVSQRENIEQERAALAWKLVGDVADGEKKEYLSYVKSAATLILTNGLTQTLAFWSANSKGDKSSQLAYGRLIQHINQLVLRPGSGDLLQVCLHHSDNQGYRRHGKEALACLMWLKRFAEAQLSS